MATKYVKAYQHQLKVYDQMVKNGWVVDVKERYDFINSRPLTPAKKKRYSSIFYANVTNCYLILKNNNYLPKANDENVIRWQISKINEVGVLRIMNFIIKLQSENKNPREIKRKLYNLVFNGGF